MTDGFASASSTRRRTNRRTQTGGRRAARGAGTSGAAHIQQVIVQRAITATYERRSFLRQSTKYNLLSTLSSALVPESYQTIVCLGLGRVHASVAAQFQLATLLELRGEEDRSVIVYDPVFDQDDWLVLRAVGLEASDETEVRNTSSSSFLSLSPFLPLDFGW